MAPEKQPATDQAKPRPPHRLKRFVARALLPVVTLTSVGVAAKAEYDSREAQAKAAATAKDYDRLTKSLANAAGVSPDTVTGKRLLPIERLPTYGQEVKRSDEVMMSNATVQVVSRPRIIQGGWSNRCTALKIGVPSDPNTTYFITAKHCVLSPDEQGGMKCGGDPPEAYNATERTSQQFGIQPIGGSPEDIAPVEAISVATFSDIALFKVEHPTQSIESIPAVTDYEDRVNNQSHNTLPGQATTVLSLPRAANGKPVVGHGVFIGSVANPLKSSQKMYLVGINPAAHAKDACDYGASGSSPVTASRGFFGPLAYRNNLDYDDRNYRMEVLKERLGFEDQLRTDLGGFKTICGYIPPNDIHLDNLVAGFGAYLPQPISANK